LCELILAENHPWNDYPDEEDDEDYNRLEGEDEDDLVSDDSEYDEDEHDRRVPTRYNCIDWII
jgi:hypothetical protein